MAPYKKRAAYRRSAARDKYSVEQASFIESVAPAGQTKTLIVAPAAMQGMRKVKHLTVSLASGSSGDLVWWALVYVPQGTTPADLTLSTVAGQSVPLYEPNQYVMSCGVMDFSAGPCRASTPLSRNLNSGDSIYLLMAAPNVGAAISVIGTVRYAITLQ